MNFKNRVITNRVITALGTLALAVGGYFAIHDSKETEVNFSEVHARHILVDSKQEADDILKEIEDKKISFENAAKKYSHCPSGKSGGDLGFFKKGMMVKEFEDSAFSLKQGEISKPVKTQFGWHLIEVIEKK